MRPDDERPVEGSDLLVRPGYSYSGLAYALSRSGVQKLLSQNLLHSNQLLKPSQLLVNWY